MAGQHLCAVGRTEADSYADSCSVSQCGVIGRHIKPFSHYLEVSAVKLACVRLVYIYRSLRGKLGCGFPVCQVTHSNNLWTRPCPAVSRRHLLLSVNRVTACSQPISTAQLTCC